MATIHEKYEFFLDVPGVGNHQAKPRTKKLIWRWEKTKGGFKRLTMGSNLTFFDDSINEIEDFTKVYPLEREGRRCDRIKLTVNIICEGSSSKFWEGYFYTPDCDWDVSACEFSVKPAPNDDYQCIEDNWEDQLNLLKFGTVTEVRDTYGELQRITCEETKFSNTRISPRDPANFEYFHASECLDVPASWTLCSNDVNIQGIGTVEVPRGSGQSTQVQTQIDIKTTYVREFTADDSPPGFGWIAVPGGFARPVEVFVAFDEETGEFQCEVARIGVIPNAVSFNEVVANIIAKFCPESTFVSNYFNINPDGQAPSGNPYYTIAASAYHEQYFIPKSEILYYGASDRATATPEVTFKKLLNDFKVYYSVELGIKDGTIYLEHESFFKGEPFLNLREPQFEFYMKGNFKYTYLKQELPKAEKWLAADLTDEIGDFDLGRVEYDHCTTSSGEEKPYKAEVTSTNIEAIIKSGRKDDEKISPNGVALVATENKVILFATGEVSGKARVNGVLSFPFCIQNNHSYRRPLKVGKFNGKFLEFQRAWPARVHKSSFCLTCQDLQQFDADGLVQSVLPWGEIDKADFEEPDGIMKLETHHP